LAMLALRRVWQCTPRAARFIGLMIGMVQSSMPTWMAPAGELSESHSPCQGAWLWIQMVESCIGQMQGRKRYSDPILMVLAWRTSYLQASLSQMVSSWTCRWARSIGQTIGTKPSSLLTWMVLVALSCLSARMVTLWQCRAIPCPFPLAQPQARLLLKVRRLRRRRRK